MALNDLRCNEQNWDINKDGKRLPSNARHTRHSWDNVQRSLESNPRQLHSGATAVQLTLCLKYLATTPQTPPFASTLGSLAPDRGNGSELTAAPISSRPLAAIWRVKSKLQVDLTSIFHFLTVAFCINRSKKVCDCGCLLIAQTGNKELGKF